jgi:hypothetical protein
MEIVELAFINPLYPPILEDYASPPVSPSPSQERGKSFYEGADAPSNILIYSFFSGVIASPPDPRQEESCISFSAV